MIPQIVAELNSNQIALSYVGQPIAHVDLVTLLRQRYAQVHDQAWRGDLAGLLITEADNLKQTISIDLDAASLPDDQAPGQVCFHCLQRSVDGATHYWNPEQGGPGEYWVCGKSDGRSQESW